MFAPVPVRRRASRSLGYAFLCLTVLCSCRPAIGQVITDNFDDNYTNPHLWTISTIGSGTQVAETNHEVEITHAADAADGASGVFGSGYISRFLLHGDFDAQVDFKLLTWPQANGVRAGISIPEVTQGSAAERTGFGSSSDFPNEPRDVYLTHLQDGVNGIVQTADLTGSLRLVRTGNTATGYYWDTAAQTWVAIHTGPVTPDDIPISLSSWSHDYAFMDQEVVVAFDNFKVRADRIVQADVPEPSIWMLMFAAGFAALGVFRHRHTARHSA